VAGREVLQGQGPALPAAAVVEVEAGLDVAVAVGERRRPGTGAGEVEAVDPTADVELGRRAAVAAGDLLAGVARVVEVRRGSERVDVRLEALELPAQRPASPEM
jgi:hypothetical protein